MPDTAVSTASIEAGMLTVAFTEDIHSSLPNVAQAVRYENLEDMIHGLERQIKEVDDGIREEIAEAERTVAQVSCFHRRLLA